MLRCQAIPPSNRLTQASQSTKRLGSSMTTNTCMEVNELRSQQHSKLTLEEQGGSTWRSKGVAVDYVRVHNLPAVSPASV